MVSRRVATLITGAFYFAIIFGFAFATGVFRVLVLTPHLGPAAAVCVEVPVLLLASWVVARWLLRGRSFRAGELIAVGTIAWVLTMASEATLATLIWGQTINQRAATLATPVGFVGLAGQLGFGIMPLAIGRSRHC